MFAIVSLTVSTERTLIYCAFFKTLFVPRVPYTVPGYFTLFTIFGWMPRFEPELLRPQPGVLPTTHIPGFLQSRTTGKQSALCKLKFFFSLSCFSHSRGESYSTVFYYFCVQHSMQFSLFLSHFLLFSLSNVSCHPILPWGF